MMKNSLHWLLLVCAVFYVLPQSVLRAQSEAQLLDYAFSRAESIREAEPLFANVFTPNNDGKNDLFGPLNYDFRSCRLQVYDRWGSQVFDGYNHDAYWNGLLPTGQPAPVGLYVYSFEAVRDPYSEKRPLYLTGTVTLLR
jgi:gliding motility-associated-like protein